MNGQSESDMTPASIKAMPIKSKAMRGKTLSRARTGNPLKNRTKRITAAPRHTDKIRVIISFTGRSDRKPLRAQSGRVVRKFQWLFGFQYRT